MNPVVVRNIKIGEGIPKICVSVIGRTEEEILKEALGIKEMKVDIVEWRADWFEGVFSFDKVKCVLANLREVLGEIPLLFTFRTAQEGGEQEIDKDTYLILNQAVIDTGNVDLVDVEIFFEESVVTTIIEYAHRKEMKIVASNHDFQKTPRKEEIVARLMKMQDMGADVLKIAVMPQSKKDVLTLLAATEEMTSNYAKQPVVTMSMSGKGVISRIAGEIFGSAITFGAAKKASAPGQIAVEELKNVLNIVHG